MTKKRLKKDIEKSEQKLLKENAELKEQLRYYETAKSVDKPTKKAAKSGTAKVYLP
jgi:hypothetical protein